jgi:hypothetical protein
MELAAVLETIERERSEAHFLLAHKPSVSEEAETWYLVGKRDAFDYAIDVVQAAIETPTMQRYFVWHYPSEVNSCWDMVTVTPDESTDTFEQACKIAAMLNDQYPHYTITLVEA